MAEAKGSHLPHVGQEREGGLGDFVIIRSGTLKLCSSEAPFLLLALWEHKPTLHGAKNSLTHEEFEEGSELAAVLLNCRGFVLAKKYVR